MNKESVARWIELPVQEGCGRLVPFKLLNFPAATFSMLLAILGSVVAGNAATLLTDKPDYLPGEHVIFSGAGWQPGETVKIDTYETSVDPFFWEGSVSATVRADGTFSNGDLLVQQSFLGQGFTAHALGASSGLTATTSFTDASSCPIPPNGIAPVSPPAGGFSIAGSLLANVPTSGVGAWVSNSIASGGGFVLYADGTAVDPTKTFHIMDAYGSGADDNFAGGDKVDRQLFRSDGHWTQLVRPRNHVVPKDFERVPLRSLFRVRRGVATGANSYFVMSQKDAKDRGLETWCVRVIAHASEILEAKGLVRTGANRMLLLSPDGIVRRRDFPLLNSYLAQGEHPRGGLPRIKDRYLCQQRDPWWQVERPNPAPVITTYMARRPPAFALNPDNLVLLNIGHYLYPRRSDLDLEAIVWELNRQKDRFAGHGRTYHGGLEKFEPREMGSLEIDLPTTLL